MMVSESEFEEFAQWALGSSFAVLIDEQDIPRKPNGRPLIAGLFAVLHTRGRLRLIIDRRPQNETESQLDWLRLPHGMMFTHLRIGKDESVRGSGDDLECFFYQLRHNESWWPRQAMGRRFKGEHVTEFGGLPGRSYRLACTVVAMGDINGTALAQATHEAMLFNHGCLQPDSVMSWG